MISLEVGSFAYDDGTGLADISLTVAAGERVLVVGASGSGKSTLARLVAGQFDAGQGHRFVGSLTLAGERLMFDGSGDDPRIDPAAWAMHVGFVGQRAHAQLSMVCTTVAEEVAFGLANRGVPDKQMHVLVDVTAQRLGLADLLDRDPRRLSGGELQRVCIAAAVVGKPGLLVLDEPFKGLDTAGRRDLEDLLAELAGSGTAILQFESMRPDELPSGSRVVELRDGTIAREGAAGNDRECPLDNTPETPLHHVNQHYVNQHYLNPPDVLSDAGETPAVQLHDLRFGYGGPTVLSVRNLGVSRGEAVALLGPNGSGKSTLLQHLNGLLQPTTGAVRLHGQDIRGLATGFLAGRVGYLFQDSDQQLFERTVLREVSYGARATGKSAKESRLVAREALEDVGLAHRENSHPHDLCFRDRRLLALASLMATGPDIWALDEPTVGLDGRGLDVLAHLIRRHTAGGGTVLMATHDQVFARAVCHRAVRLRTAKTARHP